MNRFEGQVAIVTGGALGIGGATARKFASEGARVLIADIDMHAALANADGITVAGGVAQAIRCDVSSHDDILSMVAAASEEWGGSISWYRMRMASRRPLATRSEAQ